VTGFRWLGFAVGLILLSGTASSVLKTLLIPRSSRSLFTSVVAVPVRAAFRTVAGRIDDLGGRERVLSAAAPAFLVTLLAVWLVFLLLGFGLLLWPFTVAGYWDAVREAGSSLFTLGFIRPSGTAPTLIVFLAGASGLALVAMLIAYLPVLYTAFNRRESLVTTLEALAGAPAWGPELLARQSLIGDVAYLPLIYQRWTDWAADISESHTNYRTLVFFRSPDPATSWLLALLAVLDAAALHLALAPRSAPPEARPLMRVGYITIRKLAHTLSLPVSDDPHPEDPISLTRADFDEAVEHMRKAGWTFERSADEAWPHFHGWRVNYEAAAYGLARFLDLPPAPWSGPRVRRHVPVMPARPPHREPKPTAGTPKTAADQPKAAAGQPNTAAGQPKTSADQPKTSADQPKTT
jgi:hypothetical protein